MSTITALPFTRPGTQDDLAVREVLNENCYGLPDKMSDKAVIVDIGAHIGTFAIACLSRGVSRVICYEPDPSSFELLTSNLEALYPGGAHWEAHQRALGPPDWNGRTANFCSLGSEHATACSHIDETGSSAAEIISLHAILFPLHRVDVLKLDCEGGEWLSIPTATYDDLKSVRSIVGETHTLTSKKFVHEDMAALLAPLGFHCEQRPLEQSKQPSGEYLNWLFFATRAAKKTKKPKMLCVRFPYGGCERTEVTDWLAKSVSWARDEDRLAIFATHKINDTPITMTRNLAVKFARENGFDLLLMVDNDMTPDCEPDAPAFLPAAFDFWLKHAGPCCIGAPYGGPPPNETPYVFRWRNGQNDTPEPEARISMYTREEAADLSGTRPCAALPTGLILIDMKAFDLLTPPYFYYEFTDIQCTQKASTEDVAFSRDCCFAGVPQYCAWDSWAGHNKNKCVRRPSPVALSHLPRHFCEKVISEHERGKKREPILHPESCG